MERKDRLLSLKRSCTSKVFHDQSKGFLENCRNVVFSPLDKTKQIVKELEGNQLQQDVF